MSSKLPSLPLFTDTFVSDTVHLTNEAIGMYIRLLCFAWTKANKPFTREQAYMICQCRLDECRDIVDLVLNEFFTEKENKFTQKRLVEEHEYLTRYYQKKSDAGKKGMEIRYSSVSNKTITPNPKPKPIPNKLYIEDFNKFWELIRVKKGSKKLAQQRFLKECEGQSPETIAEAFNKYASEVKDKQFVAHVATWLSQRRFEDEINNKPVEIELPPVMYNGMILKKHGEFGDQYEYIDENGKKYQKHKWKFNAKVEPI